MEPTEVTNSTGVMKPKNDEDKTKREENNETDKLAAQLLCKTLIENHIDSYHGAEKIFAINALFIIINKTRNILFPELPKGEEFDGIADAEAELSALLAEKIAALPKTEDALTSDEKTRVHNFVENTLVVNFLGPLAQSTFRNISLGATFDNNETTIEPVNVDKIAELLAAEVPELNTVTTSAELTEDLFTTVNEKLNKILSVSGLHLTKKIKRDKKEVVYQQVLNKIITLEELRKTRKLQEGGASSFIKLLATAWLAIAGGATTEVEPSSGLVVFTNKTSYEPIPTHEPHAHAHEDTNSVALPTSASYTFNIPSAAHTAAVAQSYASVLIESDFFKRMLSIFEKRNEQKTAPRYDVTVLNDVYRTLKDLRAMIHQNPAIINHLERILVEDVLITFTRYTNPPNIIQCVDDKCIRDTIAKLVDDEDIGEIVEAQSEIKEIITNIAKGNVTHVLTDVNFITKEQELGRWLMSWAADLFGGHEVASSTKAAMIQRIILTVDENKNGVITKKSIIILGNNLNSLKPLAAVYGPLKGNGFVNTKIGEVFFNFIDTPGSQQLDFITLASVNPARIASNSSTSPHLLSIFEGLRGLNQVNIQLAFYNFANSIYEQASLIIDVGAKGLTIPSSNGESRVAIPDNAIAAAHTALVQIQEITSLTIGPSGTAFLGEVITVESAQKSITAFDTGLGNLTADNPLTMAVNQAKAGLVGVANQIKDIATKTADAGYQTGLKIAAILKIMGTTMALIIPLLIIIITSSMKINWYKPCSWFLAPAKALTEAAMVFGGATGLAMISYLLGVGDNYSGVVPVLIYAVYSKSFCCFLKKKLKEDGEAPPEPQGPVIGLSAIASGAAPAAETEEEMFSRIFYTEVSQNIRNKVTLRSPKQLVLKPRALLSRDDEGTLARLGFILPVPITSRGRASSPKPRLGQGGGYRMTSKPHNRKTGKHKKSRKQKSKRLTRRRRKADK